MYDQTTLNDLFIGDNENYSLGTELTLEKLHLSTKTASLKDQIKQLDRDYSVTFEIVERPESVDFHGSIRIRPILHFIDQKIPGPQTILIGGFKSFETFFQEHVLEWSKKIGDDLKTNSRGLKMSLLKTVRESNNKLESFMRLSGLADVFQDQTINDKYQLSVLDIDFMGGYSTYLRDKLDDDNEHRHEFQFVVGLKGKRYEKFNRTVEKRIYRGTNICWEGFLQKLLSALTQRIRFFGKLFVCFKV
ncbi:hypothetical protein [Mycoplasma sp. ATU-Cv-508]|uniref:hypothetical protein n=1 Tax=Mycoplasma sp. ATU-Cv-508 TaxID=2048001 RepID=UPI000FDEB60B